VLLEDEVPLEDVVLLLESDDLPLSEDLVSDPLLFVDVEGVLPDEDPRLSVR